MFLSSKLHLCNVISSKRVSIEVSENLVVKGFEFLLSSYRVFLYWSAQFSVPKRKTLFNQRGSFVQQKFHGTESLIGCPSLFILVLKIGRTSKKKHPVLKPPKHTYDVTREHAAGRKRNI